MIRMKYCHPLGACEKSSTEYAVDQIITTQKESSSGGEMTETENCKKFCADCKTSTTPLWRCGPTGPKSLCNACGIRFRKKGTGPTLGVNKGSSEKKKEKPSASPASSSTSTTAKTTMNGTYEKGDDGKKKSVNDSYKKGIDEKTSVSSKGKGREANLNLDGKSRMMRLMGLGKEVVLLRRPRSPMKRQRSVKKLGEVEQAALLLMALSYGSVYA